ncbi:MAG: hypothetical protein ABR540_17075 [Acidimicrobiales bacterium]
MTRDTRRAGAFLVAVGGVVAMLALLAGPAAAQTSGDAWAADGSVASGSADARNNSTASGDATARNNSTASGDATAVNGSTASGCSTAINTSTASGDDCDDHKKRDHKDKDDGKDHDGKGHRPAGIGGATPARATTASLALTGSWTAPMAALAALAVALGTVLLLSTSDRRRAATSA